MNRSSRSILMNAFHPASEVDDPEFFAGRSREVIALTDALRIQGSCPIIYGDRGLGKTSLATQIQYIAIGDDELLTSLGIQDRVLNDAEQFLTFFVTCTGATKDYNKILQLLINAAEDADFTATSTGMKARRLVERTTSRKVSLKAFEAESIRKYERETSRQSYRSLSRTEKLQQLTKILTESYGQPVLFIIDELERVYSSRGLASFIKATSGKNTKFILVGLASTVGSLLADHRSLERSLIPVQLPTMTEGELYEIVEKAEAFLKAQEIDISFDHFAILKIVELAAGYPWFVHVIGQSALLLAADAKRNVVVEPRLP